VAEGVVRELVSHDRDEILRVQHPDVDVEVALPMSRADPEVGGRLDREPDARQVIGGAVASAKCRSTGAIRRTSHHVSVSRVRDVGH
jgi:hypothetical protein